MFGGGYVHGEYVQEEVGMSMGVNIPGEFRYFWSWYSPLWTWDVRLITHPELGYPHTLLPVDRMTDKRT